MSFVDTLRSARTSRVAVLHEFWTQFDPNQPRFHVFFEDHDDEVFYRHFLTAFIPSGTRVLSYRCEGKRRVYEAFEQITSRHPGVRSVLFFADKDLDDILGVAWPTDPRIFVTDVYAIENYLVSRESFEGFYQAAVRLSGLHFKTSVLVDQFETELKRFHRLILGVMAWALCLRRVGLRPNLANVDLAKLFRLTTDCAISVRPGARLQYLRESTGMQLSSVSFPLLIHTRRELCRMPAKRVVRGKFEAWFFVEFWKALRNQLEILAKEAKGSVRVKVALEHSSFIPTLAPLAALPHGLELFLATHFSPASNPPSPEHTRNSRSSRSVWQVLLGLLGRFTSTGS